MAPRMRTTLLALALAAFALPAAARADLTLRLDGFDRAATPAQHLEVPALSVGGLPSVALDEGGGARARAQRIDPALALILGIIPGFGIGHLLAGSPQWTLWLVADILIAVVAWGPFFYWSDRPGYFPLFSLLVLVERIFEGISAYQAAGGGPIFRSERGFAAREVAPVDLALPVGARAALLR